MIDPFEFKGKWWLPGEADIYSGILKFNPKEGAILELFGSFNSFMEITKQKIIHGVNDNNKITLIDNFFKSSKHGQNKVVIGIYKPRLIFIGDDYISEENPFFTRGRFKLFNLHHWLNFQNVKSEINNDLSSISINYIKPKEIYFQPYNGCAGVFRFEANPVHKDDFINQHSILESCSIELGYEENTSLTNILNDIWIMQGIITLGVFEQSYPLSIRMFYNSDSEQKSFNLIYDNQDYDEKHKIRRYFEHLYNYQEIKEDFDIIIQKWFKHFYEIEPSFSLMLSSFRTKNIFNVEKFIDIVRAIETFHRRTNEKTIFPPKVHQEMVKKILDSDNLERIDKQWLKDKLNFSNELSLKKRLEDLLSDYQNSYLLEKINEADKFIRNVKDSRNYYTHFTPRLKLKALEGEELYNLNEKLFALLISCILEHVGFDKTFLEEKLKNVIRL